MPPPFHRFVGSHTRKIHQSQLSVGKTAFLETSDRLFVVRHRPTELALIPADVWDPLLDQVGLLSAEGAEARWMTERAVIVEVTSGPRIGLGPAEALFREAGISDEVEVLGAGPYLVVRSKAPSSEGTEAPVAEIWDRAWEMLRRARAQ